MSLILRCPHLSILFAFAITVCVAPLAYANDSAASTAVGGLKLTREARVSMQKERLTIGDKRVHVEYEFLNETDADITTDVAFPIPEYGLDLDQVIPAFDDFHVWVEGKPFDYQIDTKAICRGADLTVLLRKAGVDISSFGHFDFKSYSSPDISRLSPQQQEELVKAGLINIKDKFPQWSVHKTYHWSQTFPARQILHVSHEYKPVIGFMPVSTGDLDAKLRAKRVADATQARQRDPKDPKGWYIQAARDIEAVCVEPGLQRQLKSEARANPRKHAVFEDGTEPIEMRWVDYILTTANTWKTPIKDFELVVERPEANSEWHWCVSFCWDGPIERPTPDRFVVHGKDFVPQRELRIGFLGL